MVRPQFGPSSCFKTRPHSDSYNDNMPHEEHYSRSQRGFRGQPAKGPSTWRDNRGRGRPQFIKRSPLMGERREQPFGQWTSPNQNSFHTYPSAKEPYHGNRKPSPSRPNCPPPTQPRSSPMSPARTSPGERGPSFHAHHSTHRNVSPRHYHGQPPDRRPMPAPPLHRSFRGVHRGPNPSREDARTWGPWRHPSPVENSHADRGGKRWNRRGGFAHSYNGERGPPGPAQRKPRDLYTRGLYPERSSAERDPRKQHGEMGREMEGNAHYSGEWQQDRSSFHQPLYRSPSWKGGQAHSSFYHNSPQERPEGSLPQRKRCFPEHHNDGEHDQSKHPRRDAPVFFNNGPRAFGGKPLSLRDKSRIIKGRKMRAESVLRLKAPPPPRTRAEEPKTAPKACPQEEVTRRSTLAMRKERFQENAEPLRKRPNKARQSPPNSDGNSSRSSRDSESAKEQVASQQALREHSSSPIDRLPKDLVVVSQWQAAPNSSSDEGSSSRERTSKTKTERHFTSEGQPKQKEHSSKIHVFHTSPKNHRGRYFDNQRQEHMQEENHRSGRSFRESGPPQRPFYPGPKRTFSDPAGQFRKPLMGTFVPRQFPNQKPVSRPFPNQKPVFRKSQSIMSKYRNLQTFRQRVPYQREANHRRW